VPYLDERIHAIYREQAAPNIGHLTYANVVATLALFVALSGAS
jgi:hypothetical protein